MREDAEDPDAWGKLGTRYEHDEDAQFFLVVEQLVEIRRLLRTNRIAANRMALVSVDNLAEVLLHRQRRIAARIAEDPWPSRVPRLTTRQAKRFSADFGARVAFSQRGAEDLMSARLLRPILDHQDAEIFRVGHAYRNRVYHADHHNPAMLPVLTRSYAGAVGRAFGRQQPQGVARSISDAIRQQLAKYGYDAATGSWPGLLERAFAGPAIAEAQLGDLQPSLDEAKEKLSGDLVWRADWADEMMEDLVQQGFPRDGLESALRWFEFWESTATDDELVGLANERGELWGSLVEQPDALARETAHQRLYDINLARNARIDELSGGFTPTFDVGVIESVRTAAKRLSTARNLGSLFARYRTLDTQIETVERRLDELAISWDRHVQEEVDRRRGK